jgi:hypothetical protein
MPAKDSLGPHQQACPRRLRKAIPQGSYDHPVTWHPVHPLDLALENLHLAAEGEHFSCELGLVAMAEGKHVHQDANQRIDQRSHHAGGKS